MAISEFALYINDFAPPAISNRSTGRTYTLVNIVHGRNLALLYLSTIKLALTNAMPLFFRKLRKRSHYVFVNDLHLLTFYREVDAPPVYYEAVRIPVIEEEEPPNYQEVTLNMGSVL